MPGRKASNVAHFAHFVLTLEDDAREDFRGCGKYPTACVAVRGRPDAPRSGRR